MGSTYNKMLTVPAHNIYTWLHGQANTFRTLQMHGPDPMHTLSGEVKACFSMLSGSIYCGNNKSAQVIRDYEADQNKRYIPTQVRAVALQYRSS